MVKEKEKQYIYIVQSSTEALWCKIGITGNLDERLKTYNRQQTAKSKDNIYKYLFACEVSDMRQVENDITAKFKILRQDSKTEIYLCSKESLAEYIKFIKAHPLFKAEIFIKQDEQKVEKITKIVPRTKPTLEERGITTIDVINKAKKVKDDEFYTRYEDIEKEIEMYDKNIWKDKCVFCNCDDAVGNSKNKSSAFAWYFLNNFEKLGLKKLICTHYVSKVDLFNAGSRGYIFTINGVKELKGDYDKRKLFPEEYDGSFDHPLSIKILNEEADIVCTNPPFSRSIDYWKLLIESGKKFLIISNSVVVQNTAYIHYFKDNKVWAGYNEVYWFETPKRELTRATGHWFTNLPVKNRPSYQRLKIMSLKKIPEKHKKYDDAGVLLVDYGYIPSDYKKPFAVTHNPISNGLLEKGYKIVQEKRHTPYINGKETFARVLVQKG